MKKDVKDALDGLTSRVESLEQGGKNPLQTMAEDAATTEAILNILRKKCGITNEEIKSEMNTYGSVLSAILSILYKKELATPDDIHYEVIAFHYMIRLKGLEPNMSYDDAIRQKEKLIADMKKSGSIAVAFK